MSAESDSGADELRVVATRLPKAEKKRVEHRAVDLDMTVADYLRKLIREDLD